MKYELKYHGFVGQFGYEVWEILEDGVSSGTLYPDKEAAQREVSFYNDNGFSRAEYSALLRSDTRKALEMSMPGFYDKHKALFEGE